MSVRGGLEVAAVEDTLPTVRYRWWKTHQLLIGVVANVDSFENTPTVTSVIHGNSGDLSISTRSLTHPRRTTPV